MEPVINPWIFYWISVLSNIGALLLFLMFISITVFIVLGSLRLGDIYDDDDNSKLDKWIKISIIVSCICAIVNIFIPDRNTMLAMVTAQYITIDNINVTTEYIIDLVDKINEAVKEVN